MIDLSGKTELQWLARVVRAIRHASDGRAFFIAGAQARDLLVTHAHGISTGRATRDVDFAVMLEDWAQFQQLRKGLLAGGEFLAVRASAHRLLYGQIPIDLIPFGAVERPDRTIAWPPAGDEVMRTLGFREALDQCETIQLPEDVDALVASIPGQAALKLVAWEDARMSRGSKDAQDLRTLMSAYSRIAYDRIVSEDRLMGRTDFDVAAAGAWMLGSDVARAVIGGPPHESPLFTAVRATLARETDPAGRLTLVSSMGGPSIDENLKLAGWFREGFDTKSSE